MLSYQYYYSNYNPSKFVANNFLDDGDESV